MLYISDLEKIKMKIWLFVFQATTILNSFTCSQPVTDNDGLEDTSDFGYNIVLAQVLFRHGDRSPTHSYVNDEYTEADWPQGYGQLSATGMQQEYGLGTFLRERYMSCQGLAAKGISCFNFVSEDYKREEVYVRSTSYDRTLMSAYSVLSALFPPPFTEPDSSTMESTELLSVWQPIPVHTVPKNEDHLLGPGECFLFDKLINQTLTNQTDLKLQEILSEYSELFAVVAKNSGEPNSVIGINNVLDPLYCEYVKNILPKWVTEDILGQLLELRDIYAEFSVPRTFAYLKGGSLLKEMISHMSGKMQRTVAHKLFLYSAHDTTVVALLQTMGLFNYKAPPYSACVLVELLEKDSGYFVQISYRNDSEREPSVLYIDTCGTKCPLQTFVDTYLPSLPENIVEACQNNESNVMSDSVLSYDNEYMTVSTVVNIALASVIVVTLIVCVVYYFFKQHRTRSSAKYMRVPTEMSDLA